MNDRCYDETGRRICSIPHCGKPHKGHGWCRDHLGRWQRWGDPLGGRTARGEAARFFRESLAYRGPGCLLWPYDTSGGYPVIQREGRPQMVARLVLEELEGPPPTPKHQAAHRPRECHEPLCIWGAHLRWATPAENMADRDLDGTTPRGEGHGRARLTEAKVIEILGLLGSRTDASIAAEYGVNSGTVYLIRTGRNWAHVKRPGVIR